MALNPALLVAERGWLPAGVLRWGMRRQIQARLRAERARVLRCGSQLWLADGLRAAPVAIHQQRANQQHYELPAEFFRLVLGPRLKYSCCLWEEAQDLATAEEAMLRLTCERASIEDGMRVLDLGCGWGSLATWISERYPRCEVVAVSNAHPQRNFIERAKVAAGLDNLEVLTRDVATLELRSRFDRVVSVEMFEHVRNYHALLRKIAGWLAPQGQLFVHVFCHRDLAYPYEAEGAGDWMARHFFSGGIMPSVELFDRFQDDLQICDRWRLEGEHYRRTCEAWLANFEGHRAEIRSILAVVYGRRHVDLWMQRWRMFFMACAELFGFDGGSEWGVAHYLWGSR